ncbi:MAG: hypothetical protein HUU35_12615, partial [Armatimonadetes bacterium]|nr:hypothetical protein [Armatimonadota bacterium]
PLETDLADELRCAAAPGEFESMAAVVYGLQEVRGLRATVSELRGAAGRIPASAVDIRHLLWWYQGAGRNISYSPQRELVAELLVKDPALVRVDLAAKENYLRSTAAEGGTTYLPCSRPDSSMLAAVRPVDTKELQPVEVAAGAAREFWLTLQVPLGTPAGDYRGELVLTHADGREVLPLTVKVHSLVLPAPRLTYSIYYRATLTADGQPTISSEGKSEQQYAAELADLRDHGVLYPTNYLGHDGPGLVRALELRREAGLPTERFYDLGAGIGDGTSPAALAAIKAKVERLRARTAPFGYRDLYFYGFDEATGDRLTSQKAAWRAVQEAGGKMFVAGYEGTFEAMGALLDTAVLAGAPNPKEAEKWHSVGSEAFCYANPQVGVEDPAVYRRNFGLVLRAAGFDGAMDYAYQHGFTHVWNDFDNTHYRDHNFTYPTVDGVVGTIAWEGFREGVDDVRYATALEQAIAAAPAGSTLAREAQSWLDGLDTRLVDLDEARARMIDWITRLRAR